MLSDFCRKLESMTDLMKEDALDIAAMEYKIEVGAACLFPPPPPLLACRRLSR